MNHTEAMNNVQDMIDSRVGNNHDHPLWDTFWYLDESHKACVECIKDLLQHCNHVETAENAWRLLDVLEGKR